MRREDWLLLVIGDTIEPIQIQKALFKFARETKVAKRETYSFSPYDWGPCSFEIYSDLGSLRDKGLIEAFPSGRGWSKYRLTEAGKDGAKKMRSKARGTLADDLARIREWVTSRSFPQLLKDVYEQYPGYATNSLFTK